MMLTTKSRYAVMAILDIASMNNKSNLELDVSKPINLSDISLRQNIKIKYLEQIFSKLRKAKIVSSVKGPGGGYMLACDVNALKIITIINSVEEKIKITGCKNGISCNNTGKKCNSHNLWDTISTNIQNQLSNISIYDVLHGNF